MGLLFTMHLLRRTNDLHLYSHPGLDEIITSQLRHSRSAPHFRIIFHPLEKDKRDVIFEDHALTVETIPLRHKIPCSGFLFREKTKPRRVNKEKLPPGLLLRQIANLKNGHDVTDESGVLLHKNEDLTFPPRKSRTYAYCSDTAYSEQVIEQVKNVDLLYHEATFTTDEQSKAEETLHSTSAQAALVAKNAGAARLLVGHFSARYKDLAATHEEAKAIFPETYLATEGEVFRVQD
jgi:ribonuclease Z